MEIESIERKYWKNGDIVPGLNFHLVPKGTGKGCCCCRDHDTRYDIYIIGWPSENKDVGLFCSVLDNIPSKVDTLVVRNVPTWTPLLSKETNSIEIIGVLPNDDYEEWLTKARTTKIAINWYETGNDLKIAQSIIQAVMKNTMLEAFYLKGVSDHELSPYDLMVLTIHPTLQIIDLPWSTFVRGCGGWAELTKLRKQSSVFCHLFDSVLPYELIVQLTQMVRQENGILW